MDWSQEYMQISDSLFLTDAKKSGAIFLGMDVESRRNTRRFSFR